MRKLWQFSRRRFLQWVAALGLVRATSPATAMAEKVHPAPGFQALEARQVKTLEAIAEQIIPADADPGARDAGVVFYIDHVLAGEQRDKRPLYIAGLAGTDETSRVRFERVFTELEFDQQTAVLKALEQGKAEGETWRKLSSEQFFATVWNHVLEGFYGPPSHGGNKNYASWKMVGFPEHSGMM